MKKILVTILLALFVILTLSGCEYISPQYPCVQYSPSNYRYDRRARTIPLDDNSTLIDNHPYDIVETENGFDVILHFIKEDK